MYYNGGVPHPDGALTKQYNTASAFLVRPSASGIRREGWAWWRHDDLLIQARVLFSGGKTLVNNAEINAPDTVVNNALLAYTINDTSSLWGTSYEVKQIYHLNTIYMFAIDNAGTAP
jgi:hypothetical protein